SARGIFRSASGSVPGAQPQARPLGERRRNAQNGGEAETAGVRRRVREDHRGASKERGLVMSTSPAPQPVEPWMRGTHRDVPAVGRAVLHALELALEDLKKWTSDLTDAEIRSQPFGLMPVARHLRHIARSTDRILTYAEGGQLSDEQLKALEAEDRGEESLGALFAEIEASFRNAAERIRARALSDLEAHRSIGR